MKSQEGEGVTLAIYCIAHILEPQRPFRMFTIM